LGKDSPAPPPAPDPAAVAAAQTTGNVQTAIANSLMNRVNQVTPYGNLTYTQNGTTDVGGNQVPSYTATQTLNPDQQAAVTSQQQLTKGLYGLGNDQLGRIADTLSKPLNYDGLATLQQGLDSSGLTQLKTALGPLAKQATDLDWSQFANQPTSLNTRTLSAMPTDPTQMNQQVSNAIYNQSTSRLDPQWQQAQTQLQTQLVNQGIPQNSDAWNKAMMQFAQQKNDAYNTANNSAITSGAQIGGTDYGLALQGRQQGVNEQTTSAGLANQANAAALARQQAAAQLANTANQTGIQYGMDNASLAQAAHQQGIQDQLANAGLAQTARQQGIQERTALYNQPLNETSALMSGGQVQGPSFVNVPQANVANTDYIGAQSLATQAQMANYQNQMANQSSQKGGAGSMIGTLGSAAMM